MTGADGGKFEVLRQRVHGDPALQARLFALTEPQEFITAVRQAARAFGLALSDGEVQLEMRVGRQAWSDRKRS